MDMKGQWIKKAWDIGKKVKRGTLTSKLYRQKRRLIVKNREGWVKGVAKGSHEN
jgi:hypothetical protein